MALRALTRQIHPRSGNLLIKGEVTEEPKRSCSVGDSEMRQVTGTVGSITVHIVQRAPKRTSIKRKSKSKVRAFRAPTTQTWKESRGGETLNGRHQTPGGKFGAI